MIPDVGDIALDAVRDAKIISDEVSEGKVTGAELAAGLKVGGGGDALTGGLSTEAATALSSQLGEGAVGGTELAQLGDEASLAPNKSQMQMNTQTTKLGGNVKGGSADVQNPDYFKVKEQSDAAKRLMKLGRDYAKRLSPKVRSEEFTRKLAQSRVRSGKATKDLSFRETETDASFERRAETASTEPSSRLGQRTSTPRTEGTGKSILQQRLSNIIDTFDDSVGELDQAFAEDQGTFESSTDFRQYLSDYQKSFDGLMERYDNAFENDEMDQIIQDIDNSVTEGRAIRGGYDELGIEDDLPSARRTGRVVPDSERVIDEIEPEDLQLKSPKSPVRLIDTFRRFKARFGRSNATKTAIDNEFGMLLKEVDEQTKVKNTWQKALGSRQTFVNEGFSFNPSEVAEGGEDEVMFDRSQTSRKTHIGRSSGGRVRFSVGEQGEGEITEVSPLLETEELDGESALTESTNDGILSKSFERAMNRLGRTFGLRRSTVRILKRVAKVVLFILGAAGVIVTVVELYEKFHDMLKNNKHEEDENTGGGGGGGDGGGGFGHAPDLLPINRPGKPVKRPGTTIPTTTSKRPKIDDSDVGKGSDDADDSHVVVPDIIVPAVYVPHVISNNIQVPPSAGLTLTKGLRMAEQALNYFRYKSESFSKGITSKTLLEIADDLKKVSHF